MTPATTKTLAWRLSSSLKRSQLQAIATSIGAPVSGTKNELLSSIHELVNQTSSAAASALKGAIRSAHDGQSQDLRVLSIDMGIRNLAFAFMTCRRIVTSNNISGKDEAGEESTSLTFSKPQLHQWRRFELLKFNEVFNSGTQLDVKVISTATNTLTTSSSNTTPEVPSLSTNSSTPQSSPADSFEPSTLSTHAYTFAKYCTCLNPTHILIERQRFRSAGHAAVLEWSLRVGVLEAMLHAAFRTFVNEGILPHDVQVMSILPRRVNKFWFDEKESKVSDGGMLKDGDVETEKSSKGAKAAKLAKIAIVGDMLRKCKPDGEGAEIVVGEDAMPTYEAFMAEIARQPGARKMKVTGSTPTSSLEKLDDVSDSLLQGLAWLRWQENRARVLIEGGEEAEEQVGGMVAKKGKKKTASTGKSAPRKKSNSSRKKT